MESAICRGSAILGVGKSTAFWQRKGKCVAKFGKTPYFGVKMGIKIPTVEDTIVSNKGRYYGADDRTRTCTLLALEPKSNESTKSTTSAYLISYTQTAAHAAPSLNLPPAVLGLAATSADKQPSFLGCCLFYTATPGSVKRIFCRILSVALEKLGN